MTEQRTLLNICRSSCKTMAEETKGEKMETNETNKENTWKEKVLGIAEEIAEIRHKVHEVLPEDELEKHNQLNNARGSLKNFNKVANYLLKNLVTGSHDTGQVTCDYSWRSSKVYVGVNQSGLWMKNYSGGRPSVETLSWFVTSMKKKDFLEMFDLLEAKIIELDLRTKNRSLKRIKKVRDFMQSNFDSIYTLLNGGDFEQCVELNPNVTFNSDNIKCDGEGQIIPAFRAIRFSTSSPRLGVWARSKEQMQEYVKVFREAKEKLSKQEYAEFCEEKREQRIDRLKSNMRGYGSGAATLSDVNRNDSIDVLEFGLVLDELESAFEKAKDEQREQREKVDVLESDFNKHFMKEILAVAATKM